MEHELRDAMQAGAIGFTTSRTDQHETSDDRPVASRLASWDEVRRLVGVLDDLGTGVFEIASEFNRGMDPARREAVLDAIRDLAVESRVPMTFGVGSGRRLEEMLRLVDTTAAAGGRMFGQTHSRGISVVLSFLSRTPFDRLPVWSEVRALPPQEQLAGAARRVVAPEARRRRDPRRLRTCHRRRGASPRLHPHARLRPPGAAEPDRRRSRRRARPGSRRADPRSRGRERPPPALHPAPHPDGRRRSPRRDAAPSHRDDVLRRRRARQPDLRRVDPDAPARVLGASSARRSPSRKRCG